MGSLLGELEALASQAIAEVTGVSDAAPMIAATRDEKHGDYQCNAAMALAKRIGRKPRELAAEVQAKMQELDAAGLLTGIEVAGPGFLNLSVNDGALCERVEHGGVAQAARGCRVVVDYSCPNIAKQMHVGHLRSTIIGDAICRILEHLGYEVIRQNHVGDWGTQFGLLCAWVMDQGDGKLHDDVDLSDLEALYRASQALANSDPEFRRKSRARVVALHNGDAETIATWKRIVEKSVAHIEKIYERLGVKLRRSDMRGESFYNPRLPGVVKELEERFPPAARVNAPAGKRSMEVLQDNGAMCVFVYDEKGEPAYKNADDERQPMLIRKADGAFLYPTTDLAALRFRVDDLQANWIIYVTDARQVLHFKMFFDAATLAGWTGDARLEHITFGSVLGPDNKPLKTRSGENVKLAALLDEAVERARGVIECNDKEGHARFSEEEVRNIVESVGIGAVKYADLSQNRGSDYVFSFDKMLAMEGNTAPYLMYAYARIRSIERKAGKLPENARLLLGTAPERRLALHLARFDETLGMVVSGWRINLLCEYLYNLAGLYMRFYENCPVLSASEPALRDSRLELCERTGRILKIGLDLLGINVLEQM